MRANIINNCLKNQITCFLDVLKWQMVVLNRKILFMVLVLSMFSQNSDL